MLRNSQSFKSILLFAFVALFALQLGCGDKNESNVKVNLSEPVKAAKKVWIERWAQERPLQLKRAGLAAVAHNNRIYAIGGGDFIHEGLKIFDSVEYTEVQPDGSLGEWKYTSPLTTRRVYPVSAIYNGYIYLMGGESKDTIFTGEEGDEPPTLLNSVERAKIMPDGSLGKWILEPEVMSFARRGGELFFHNGYIYAAGGFNGAFLNDVEKAKVNPDGSIGPWSREDEWINEVRYISGYFQKENNFYVIGGHINSPARATESVEYAKAKADSNTTAWKETSPLHTRSFLNTALLTESGNAYTIAGHNTINLTAVERTTINDDGTLTAWEPDTPINIPRRAAVAVEVNDVIYLVGGMIRPMAVSVSIDSVESARIEKGKQLGNWIEEGSEGHELYKGWKTEINKDAKNHILHGKAYLNRKKYETALFDVNEALKVEPDYSEAYNLKADILFRTGKKTEAAEVLKKSLSISDTMEALIGLAFISADNGDFTEAVELYKRAVKVDPESIVAHYNLGQSYLSIDDYPNAEKEFVWILEKEPDSKEAKHFLEMTRNAMKKVPTH